MSEDFDNHFADSLFALTSKEATSARKDKTGKQFGAMIEAIARTLGFTIALATKGDPKGIDNMIAGAEAYAHEEAVEKAKFAKLFEGLRTS